MTRLTPTDVLKDFAHRLQLAAPTEWEQFTECFDAYATEITVAVTLAAQHEILNQQGKAQMALHLLRAFRECHIKPAPPPTPQQPAAQQP